MKKPSWTAASASGLARRATDRYTGRVKEAAIGDPWSGWPGWSAVAAVIVDVDGTLYDPRRGLLRRFFRSAAFRAAWRRWGRGPGRRQLRAYLAAREALRAKGSFSSGAAFDAALLSAWSAAATEAGGNDGSPARLADVRTELEGALPALLTAGHRPFPGARAALASVPWSGRRLAVFSDYPAEEKLANLGLADLGWDGIFSADAQGALKPDPSGLQAVARSLGVPPARCLYVGDRDDTDVPAAHAAGFVALRFGAPSSHPGVPWRPDWAAAIVPT